MWSTTQARQGSEIWKLDEGHQSYLSLFFVFNWYCMEYGDSESTLTLHISHPFNLIDYLWVNNWNLWNSVVVVLLPWNTFQARTGMKPGVYESPTNHIRHETTLSRILANLKYYSICLTYNKTNYFMYIMSLYSRLLYGTVFFIFFFFQ